MRLLFWGITLCMVWPFILSEMGLQVFARNMGNRDGAGTVGAGRAAGAERTVRCGGDPAFADPLQPAVCRADALDLVYLWGGVALPDGMTYAGYAHRGAYPLIATALLAAGFVLVAMRPGGPAERSPMIRTLVFLWVAQNVMLVMSSMLRLELYVEIYSADAVARRRRLWMVLVAAGLVLILRAFAFNRSNAWLIAHESRFPGAAACISALHQLSRCDRPHTMSLTARKLR